MCGICTLVELSTRRTTPVGIVVPLCTCTVPRHELWYHLQQELYITLTGRRISGIFHLEEHAIGIAFIECRLRYLSTMEVNSYIHIAAVDGRCLKRGYLADIGCYLGISGLIGI